MTYTNTETLTKKKKTNPNKQTKTMLPCMIPGSVKGQQILQGSNICIRALVPSEISEIRSGANR